MATDLQQELENARRTFYLHLGGESPTLLGSRANIRSGRALGKLSSAVERGDMNIAQAVETAHLSPDLGLQGAEVEWVVDKLLDEYGAKPSSGGEGRP